MCVILVLTQQLIQHEYLNNYNNSVPMKRLGTIEEVVKSVAYLLSDDSSYTTGTNLVIDGGMSSGLKA
jgi:NAD(P)-dependent dehydrogenase (short-subunit alcohol dehydrogenase family)